MSMVLVSFSIHAAPTGGEVVGGQGTITAQGLNTTINQSSERMAIDWQSFNVEVNESVRFDQPNRDSVSLNRILDQNPTHIFGSLDANGQVILVNPRGVVFSETASVNVGGLVASGLDISTANFMNNNLLFKAIEGTDGVVVNKGLLNAATGGSISLIGKSVANEGLISAKLGKVNLASGSEAVITFDQAGLIGVEVTQEVLENDLGLDSATLNKGSVESEGGRVVMSAKVSKDIFSNAVNNTGIVKATSIEYHNGSIFLGGSGGNVTNSGQLDVSAEHDNVDGGNILVTGDNVTSNGIIKANAASGNGGRIELNSQDTTMLTENSLTSARAESTGKGGEIFALGKNVGLFDQASVDVSGANGGGTALIGGDERGENPAVKNAEAIYIGEATSVKADALTNGDGGRLIAFASNSAKIYGDLSATGGKQSGNGGFIETSGKISFDLGVTPDITAINGDGGYWLIDPRDVDIVSGSGRSRINNSSPFSPTGNSAQLGVNLIRNALTGGVTVEVNTGSGGNQQGDITLSTNLDYNSKGTNTLKFVAADDIYIEGRIFDSTPGGTTPDSLNIEFIANDRVRLDNYFGTENQIETNGGYFYAEGASFRNNNWDTRSIYTGGGDITLNMSTGDIELGRIDTGSGDLIATTAGNITQSTDPDRYLSVCTGTGLSMACGNTILSAGGNISLNSGNNDFSTLTIANASVVSINDGVGDITLQKFTGIIPALSATSADYFTTSSGDITVTAVGNINVIDQVNGSGTNLNLNAGSGGTGSTVDLANAIINNNRNVTITTGSGSDIVSLDNSTNAATLTGNLAINTNAGTDNILLGDATVAGTLSINGGGGSDTVTGFNVDSEWRIIDKGSSLNGLNEGEVRNSAASLIIDEFLFVENLVGGDGVDTFNFTTDITGDVSGGTGADVFNFNGTGTQASNVNGGIGDDSFNFTNTSAISGNLNGNGGNDTFSFNSTNSSGIVGGTVSGNAGDDVFNFLSSLSATLANNIVVDGGSHTLGDIANYSAVNGGIIADLNVNVLNVENVTGSTSSNNDTIVGLNGDTNTWTFQATDSTISNSVPTVTFNEFSNLTGGDAADTFTINADPGGTIAGGAGNDTFIVADNISVTSIDGGNGTSSPPENDQLDLSNFTNNINWNISTASGGSATDTAALAATVSFSNIEGLEGSAVNDNFAFNNGVLFAGTIDGGAGAGIDTLDYSAFSGINIVTVDINNLINIDTLIGGSGVTLTGVGDTLIGPNVPITWDITGANSGSVGGVITFSSFENLTGGSEADRFVFTSTGSLINGTLDGGPSSGTATENTLVARTGVVNTWNFITTTSGSLADTGGGYVSDFANIHSFVGGGTGNEWANLSGTTGTINAGSYFGFTGIIGNGSSSTLRGQDGETNNWDIQIVNDQSATPTDGIDDGIFTNTNGTLTFIDFGNLEGGDSIDNFNFNGGTITGTVNGAGGNDVFNVTAALANVRLTGGTGNDRFNINSNITGASQLLGGADNDIFDIANGVSVSTSLSGVDAIVGEGGNDTLDLADVIAQDLTWSITPVVATTSGNVTDTATTATITTFDQIENFIGSNTRDDTFKPTNDIDGIATISAGGHTSGDSLDYSTFSTAVTVNLLDLSGFEIVRGSTQTTDTLIGDNNTNTWTVDGATNQGCVAAGVIAFGGCVGGGGVQFQDFENLTGGNAIDTFQLNTSVTGNINAGIGADVFNLAGGSVGGVANGQAGSDIFTISQAINQGQLDGGSGNDIFNVNANVSGASQLRGGTGNDLFDIANGVIVSTTLPGGNVIVGGANIDTLDLADAAQDLIWNITNSTGGGNITDITASTVASFNEMEILTGSAASNDSIIGNDNNNTWTLEGGANRGCIAGAAQSFAGCVGAGGTQFQNFDRLTGGAGSDVFNIQDGGSVSNGIDGGVGSAIDTLDYSSRTTAVNIDLENNTATATGGISNFDDYIGGTSASDTFTAANLENTWEILTDNSGRLNSLITFAGFENLNGGSLGDEFIFGDSITFNGVIDARGGLNTLNFSLNTTGINLDISTLFNFSSLIGTSQEDTIRASDNNAHTWTISSRNTGDMNGFQFSEIENLVGGTNNDTFIFADGVDVTGLIDGTAGGINTLDYTAYTTDVTIDRGNTSNTTGVGNFSNITDVIGGSANDTLVGINTAPETWFIKSVNGGDTSSGFVFSSIENLTGGNNIDTFNFAAGASIAGQINGGADRDTLDYSSITTGVTVDLGAGAATFTGGIVGIEDLQGSQNSNDVLVGLDSNNTWDITGNNLGAVGTFTFSDIENLTGGNLVDQFNIVSAANLSGEIVGGNGNDILTIDYSNATRSFTFDGQADNDTVVLNGVATGQVSRYDYNASTPEQVVNTINLQNANIQNTEQINDEVTATILDITGTTVVDAMQLNSSAIAGVDPILFSMTGHTSINSSNKTNLSINALAGIDSLDVLGNFTLPGTVTLDVESITNSSDSIITASNIVINNSASIGTISQNIRTATDNLQLSNINGDVFITENDGVNIQDSTIQGDFNFTNLNGDTAVVGAMNVTGTSSFTGSNLSSVVVNNTGNNFIGSLSFNAITGSLANVDLRNGTSVNLINVNSADLTVNANGNITDSGTIIATGQVILDASGGDVILDDNNNDFGDVDIQNANQVILVDQSDIGLNNITATTSVNITAAGEITDANGGNTNIIAESASLAANNGIGHSDLLETQVANLVVNNVSAGNIDIGNIGDLTINSATNTGTANGSIKITSTGNITQISDINSAGAVEVSAGANYVQQNAINANDNVSVSARNNISQNGDIRVSSGAANIQVSTVNGVITMADSTQTTTTGGSIRYAANGTVNVSSLDAVFGVGRVEISSNTGDILSTRAPDTSRPNVTGNIAEFTAPSGSLGTFGRPLVINVPGSVIINTQTSVDPIYLVQPVITNNSRVLFGVTDAKAGVGGSQRTEIDALAIIDPAIFTRVKNHREGENPIKLPADQLAEDEEDGENSNQDPDIFDKEKPYEIEEVGLSRDAQ